MTLPLVACEAMQVDKFTKATTASTVIIAVMAIVQAFIFWRQWKAMRDQLAAMRGQLSEMQATSKQTEKAAEAARKSADALINSERAWVMVDVEFSPSHPRLIDSSTHTTASIRLVCRNEGRTPAWITAKRACLKVVRNVAEALDSGEMQSIQQGYEPLSVNAPNTQSAVLSGPLEHPLSENDTVVVYGVVEYRDALSNSCHETLFGYTISERTRLMRIRDSAYNRAT